MKTTILTIALIFILSGCGGGDESTQLTKDNYQDFLNTTSEDDNPTSNEEELDFSKYIVANVDTLKKWDKITGDKVWLESERVLNINLYNTEETNSSIEGDLPFYPDFYFTINDNNITITSDEYNFTIPRYLDENEAFTFFDKTCELRSYHYTSFFLEDYEYRNMKKFICTANDITYSTYFVLNKGLGYYIDTTAKSWYFSY